MSHPGFVNLAGQRFGKLMVVEYVGPPGLWRCRCDCGQECQANATGLRIGRIVKCRECRAPTKKAKTKTCTGCKLTLPYTAEHFAASQQHKFGLRAKCRKCVRKITCADSRDYLKRLRLEALTHYSGGPPKCACCGETIIEFLALDHLEGSSQADYREFDNSLKLIQSLRKRGWPKTFRVLCHNCNSCVGIYGRCAHDPQFDWTQTLRKTRGQVLIDDPTWKKGRQECIACGISWPRTVVFFSEHRMMLDGMIRKCRDCEVSAKRTARGRLRRSTKMAVMTNYCNGPPRCECCGLTTFELLTIDHIEGGGAVHRKNDGFNDICRWLQKHGHPEGFQVLCFSCNQAKGYYGKCPHTCLNQ